ncbi:hypothetical protein Tco_0837147 [Tanacetum coccineum]
MVIAEPGVGATTRSAAHMGSSSLRSWIVSLIEWNSSISLTKSSIQSAFRFRLSDLGAKMIGALGKDKELFNRLCQCEKDDWLSLQDWFWSSFMPPYERKYVDVKFSVASGERTEEVNEEGNERRRESEDVASVTDDDRTPSKALKYFGTVVVTRMQGMGRQLKRWTKGNLHPKVQSKKLRSGHVEITIGLIKNGTNSDLVKKEYYVLFVCRNLARKQSLVRVEVDVLVTKSDKHDTSSSSGNYLTHVVDADIRPVNDQVPFVEVQLTAQHNVLANGQQHTEQSEPIYDTYLLEKIDSNTTPDSTNISHRGGEIDQDAEQYQVKSPLLNAEFFKTKDMVKKEVYNELSNRFLQLEKYCISLEISIQQKEESFQSNKPLAKLLKENETLKKHYKDLYDSVKVTRTKTIQQTTSLMAKNDEFKAQLQEKGFIIAALKNELRKLKGNSVDTKFAKPSIMGKLFLQPPRNQSVVRQPNAFKSERPNFSKPQFASQVDVNNVLSKSVTPYYLPKVQEYVLAKPYHVIAPDSSRNSQEESYGSNDMAHNYYLEEARKKTQERNRNSKSSVMHTTSLQNTTNGSKQNPRSNNQISRSSPISKSSGVTSNSVPLEDHSRNSMSFSDSKHFVCSTCQKCVFNANHDDCITKFLKEVNSRAKVQSPKSRNNIKPGKRIPNVYKPKRWISKGYRFSPNKSSVMHEKLNTPRSCLRWKLTGRIFKIAGLRWIPNGKMFIDNTTKVDSKPLNGSNDDITNPYECDQTLNVSAGTLNLSADNTSGPVP